MKKFIDLKKLSVNDHNIIKDLCILMMFRYSLKLVRNYPSIKKAEMREVLILEYQDNKKEADPQKIQELIFGARAFLSHLITYELAVRSLREENSNSLHLTVGVDSEKLGIPLKNNQKSKKDKDFEYF